MSAPRPPFSIGDAETIAATHYGVVGGAKELPAELDRNFLIEAEDGARVLKVSPPGTGDETLLCQNRVLEVLAASELSRVMPALCPSRKGLDLLHLPGPNGISYRVRLLSYLDGVPIARLRHHPAQLLGAVGRLLGRLDQLLLNLDHPGARRVILWDLTRTLELEESLGLIAELERRQLVAMVLDEFRRTVQPQLGRLRRSIIHNDANDYNILVDPGSTPPVVTGLIDFGDMVHTITAAEPAIACAYLMLGKEDPWAAAEQVLAGYQAVLPLQPLEQELLPALIRARLATSVLMAARSHLREPDNEYLLVSEAPVWNLLERLIPP